MTTGGPVLVVLAAGRARRYGGCKPLAPVGVNGEAVLDLVVGDAVAAGFGAVVLVVNPSTGPSIRYRVEHAWPADLDVRFAVQERPLGTVHAVLAASGHLPDDEPFAVANADDIYGQDAYARLVDHLGGESGRRHSALVGFRLRNSVVSDAPVTRGICQVDAVAGAEVWLRGLDERRKVHPVPGTDTFAAEDGREPHELDADALVSVNLWGFSPAVRQHMEATMRANRDASEEAEVLLPEMVANLVAGSGADHERFEVLVTESRCIGVTHPDDLALVQEELVEQVANGERAASPWSAVTSS